METRTALKSGRGRSMNFPLHRWRVLRIGYSRRRDTAEVSERNYTSSRKNGCCLQNLVVTLQETKVNKLHQGVYRINNKRRVENGDGHGERMQCAWRTFSNSHWRHEGNTVDMKC